MNNNYTLSTDKTWAATLADLSETFRKWEIADWEVLPGIAPRLATRKTQSLSERSVTVRYKEPGHEQETVLTMDEQARAVDNFRVLYLAIEAMRMNKVRGIDGVIRQAYLQLEPPKPKGDDPYKLLGVKNTDSLAAIETAFRTKVQAAHPDHGGSGKAVGQLTAAIRAIREERA